MKGKKGKRIWTVAELQTLVNNKRCVIGNFPHDSKHVPAVIYLGMPLRTVLRFLNCGLWEYIKAGEDRIMKPCPICEGELAFHQATMLEYSWLDPFVDCVNPSCGFKYSQDQTQFHQLAWKEGQGGFEQQRKAKDFAESALRVLFKIK